MTGPDDQPVDASDIDPDAEQSADELDGVRIRQLAALKRGAYRARSYALIVAAAGAVAGVQLIVMTLEHVLTRGWGAYPTGYVLAAAVAAMLVFHFGRRAMELHREIRTPAPLP